MSASYTYCPGLTQYQRRETRTVQAGDLLMGSAYPIRVQSMTTTDTMDTAATVAQSIRMIEAGCELVRITAPSIKEAQNLELIKKELRAGGYTTPLVADIHFTPNAAEVAARIVEKVRINPGNYADKKKFELIEYTDTAYAQELERIREKFIPLVKVCKEYGTCMRIGTNHGSLSDRIMSRYGDTPLGMVESALEFLRICQDENYHNLVLSMKASNPQIMVQAYRLLVNRMDALGWNYPLHLGVTEAGDGEDGRIKSAVGIGSLLEDGLGDTIRVSLTEDPEFEIPVARSLVDRYPVNHANVVSEWVQSRGLQQPDGDTFDPFNYHRHKTREIFNIGAHNVPRVIADLSISHVLTESSLEPLGHIYDALLDKWHMTDSGCDYIYTGNQPVPFMLPNGLKAIYNYTTWQQQPSRANSFPLYTPAELSKAGSPVLNFVQCTAAEVNASLFNAIAGKPFVLLLAAGHGQSMAAQRQVLTAMHRSGIDLPVIICRNYKKLDAENSLLYPSTDIGALFIDGWGDGIMIDIDGADIGNINHTAFGILQATRTRISKTEYISCPSCGRTLFDLQETTARIRKRTDHLKGIKIGIMGCIVNGPGEMADADYGYVGTGPGRITLYRGKEIVKRNVSEDMAVDELITIIQDDGNWVEKNAQNTL